MGKPTVAQSIGQSGKPVTPAVTPAKLDSEFDDDNLCPVCGGEGFIMAWEGDGSDWGEDTYSGPMDESIQCRHCNGTGVIT